MKTPASDQVIKVREMKPDDIIRQYTNLQEEADLVRPNDKVMISGLLQNFYRKKLDVGIGFKRAYGALLSGDYFELFKLRDGNFLFVFADICGHGLPAYTTLIRLRSAIILGIEQTRSGHNTHSLEYSRELITAINKNFITLMNKSLSSDFASILFTFISNDQDNYYLRFVNNGTYFPLIIRKFKNEPMDIYNLNEEKKGWIPQKWHLLSSEIQEIIGELYFDFPVYEFIIYEGDSILYFTDGLIEDQNRDNSLELFGMERFESLLINLVKENHLSPQQIIDSIYQDVFEYMGSPKNQLDDMTAVLFDFPLVRKV